MTASGDWLAAVDAQARRGEVLLWPLAAGIVAALAAAASVALLQADARFGRETAPPEAVYLQLDGGDGPSAAVAAPEAAPSPPMTTPPRPAPAVTGQTEDAAPERAPHPAPIPDPVVPILLPSPLVPEAVPSLPAPPKSQGTKRPPKAATAKPTPGKHRKRPDTSKPKAAAPAAASAVARAGAGLGSGAAPQGAAASLTARWGAQIRSRIERAAEGGGATGTVGLRLTLSQTGRLAGAAVARSSGNPVLDRMALRAVKRAGPFPAAPVGLPGARFAFTLSIRFRE
ncbi:outer membrane transport energization protein TonB [Rhodobacter viridis]|uniref:Outer membrane transport energization protein TonB n=1 Tax=Rhodobacter viridis TaxID=1054202 RepID=A0A318TWA5_9RHOB|nr:energy transducer TonB [Rhodobacter viridis]PYF08683.1 outer membrane transport energization protein TonB [Rhodobacter viridis]